MTDPRPQPSLWDGGCDALYERMGSSPVRSTPEENSQAAAASLEGATAATLRWRVLHLLVAEPRTCERVMDATGLKWNSVSPRLTELYQAGITIRRVKVRVRSGRHAWVQEVEPWVLACLEANE